MLHGMDRWPGWDRLLASLATWADVREVPGGVEVSYVGRSRTRQTVEIVMTPGDWEEMAECIGIENEDSIRQRLLALAANEHFLVCDSGVELVASPTRELSPDDDVPPEPGGQWVVTDDAANVVSRFADWDGNDD